MLVTTEVFEQVLQECGINWATIKEAVNRSKYLMSEKSEDRQKYLDKLYLKAIDLGIKPTENGTICEQQAIRLLGKSPAYFRVARKQGRLTPNCVLIGNTYRYTMYDLAEYLEKKDRYKAL
ncbi:hypothetical protein [Acinetobacter sp. MD2(2019)]|uniref:hypothetical protein n=1 Tax=Acinetobacter sp. MD2(2019) TaxID=2605273 RepID=UPI002D1ED0FA|nr:hypothetical protein [Acinetobacter sp. MD2(2019)]MEB3754303.1 hypothetical protein [Acinetobacter sp. MD2(2019)]